MRRGRRTVRSLTSELMMAQKDSHVSYGKEDEADFSDSLVPAKELGDGARRDLRGLFARVAVGARRDGGEGHALKRARRGQRERVAVGRGQQLGLAPATVDWPHGVNHKARGQEPARRDDGLARREPFGVERASQLSALFEYPWAARAVDGAVHAPAAEQRRVGGVDDGVHGRARDVADRDADAPAQQLFCLSLFGRQSGATRRKKIHAGGARGKERGRALAKTVGKRDF